MRLRHFFQTCAAAGTLAITVAGPASAQDDRPLYQPGVAPPGADMRADARPEWQGNGQPQQAAVDPRARADWLAECRHRVAVRDDGAGGAVIGGLFGGFLGNRIAGRHHRTVGTVAGAAVGAVAGSAIDKAEDIGRARDECETYLDDYYAYYTRGGGAPGYGGYAYVPGYGQGCCQGAPVAMAPGYRPVAGPPKCTETVEYVDEYVPVRPRARRVIHDKRARVEPGKRIKVQ